MIHSSSSYEDVSIFGCILDRLLACRSSLACSPLLKCKDEKDLPYNRKMIVKTDIKKSKENPRGFVFFFFNLSFFFWVNNMWREGFKLLTWSSAYAHTN